MSNSRREQAMTSGGVSNPSAKWLEWDSNNKGLRYYDKDTAKNVTLKLPIKLVYLTERSTIVGFDDKTNSRIYSNDVEFINDEAFTVRSKGGILVSGMYSSIKTNVGDLGASYAKRIYAILDGEIVNIVFKGDTFSQWINFTNAFKKNNPLWLNNSFVIESAEDRKKGATKWSVPVFAWGAQLTQGEKDIANQAFDSVDDYFLSKKETKNTASKPNDLPESMDFIGNAPVHEPVGETDEDDLPF